MRGTTANNGAMYPDQRPFRSESIPIRTLSYRVCQWGSAQPDTAPLVLLHGWMDVAASFQFVVDALSPDFFAHRWIIAPDWRGFGLSTLPAPCDHYTFPDYLADLDQLLDHYCADRPIDLVGHSMGGNIAMMYAGVRPRRIRRLVNLEGFGLPASRPTQAPQRYAQWMDEIRQLERGEMALKTYDSVDGVAQRLMKTNPRLSADKAQWLARHWARPNAQGQWEILGDPAHKITNPQLYRLDETLALYAAITAPVLAVQASDDSLGRWWKEKYTLAQYHERLASVARCTIAEVADAGHMLHHDQPQTVAAMLEQFLTAPEPA